LENYCKRCDTVFPGDIYHASRARDVPDIRTGKCDGFYL
jgi:hypothetical protein